MFSRKYCTEVTNLSTLSVFEVEIWCFRGGDIVPKWIIRDAGSRFCPCCTRCILNSLTDDFSTLCYVRADLSPLAGSATSKVSRSGKTYWTIVFSIEIHFGLTEFKARIKWVDDVSDHLVRNKNEQFFILHYHVCRAKPSSKWFDAQLMYPVIESRSRYYLVGPHRLSIARPAIEPKRRSPTALRRIV